jgi:hypothetical protein
MKTEPVKVVTDIFGKEVTVGTKLARETRILCNKLTDAERTELKEKALRRIRRMSDEDVKSACEWVEKNRGGLW